MYVVKMNGMKVRDFDNVVSARAFVKHCRGDVEIVHMNECKRLPRACKPIHPNLDMPDLRYKPFVGLV